MATTVSVSFSNGFVGDYSKNNLAINSSYLTALGWSNFQFSQISNNGQFGGSQGNDYTGTIIVTDANGVEHSIDGVINWRAPSGSVTTMVFYATGVSHTLATSSGTYTVDPWNQSSGDPHTFIGLTFNGTTLTITGGQVSGNAATSGLLDSLNTYLANQPQISISDLSINEGSGSALLTVSLNKASADPVTVAYQTANGTATTNTDYTSNGGTLTFAPGETSKTVTVSINDDSAVEGAENFSVILSDSTYAAIVKNTGAITIIDNDGLSITSVIAKDAANTGASPVDSTVVEGANLQYTVSLSAATSSITEYTLAISGAASISDYGNFTFSNNVAWKDNDPTTGIIVIPTNVTSFSITVPTTDDSLIENTESLVLTVGGVAGTGTITDNDSQSVTRVTVEDAANTNANPTDSTVVEGANLQYTVNLNAASPSPTEYTLAISGTASISDYGNFIFSESVTWKNNDPTTGIIVIPTNVTSFSITVPTTDDNLIENAENLVLTVGGVAGTGTITDNDSQSVTRVTVEDAGNTGANPADNTVVEGANLQYTVSLNATSPSATEHTLTISGTASISDYENFTFSDSVGWKNNDPTTGVIVIPANITSFNITVPTTDDSLIENAESLVLTVGGVAGTGTITDNDNQSVTSVIIEDTGNTGANPTDNTVVEGASLRYAVNLNAASPSPTEYTLAISGTASISDYGNLIFSSGVAWKNNDPTTGIIVIPANITSFNITVPTTDDNIIENAESLVLTVGGVAGTGTITDNDDQSVTSVTVEDATNIGANPADNTVVEGASLRYTVNLNAASPSPTEHTLAIGGTASISDYGNLIFSSGVAWKNNNPTTGIIVIPANITSFSITVPTTDDNLIENAESLVLTVGGVAGTGTITDNDNQSITSVTVEDAANIGANPTDNTVVEGASLRYMVNLNAASPSATEHTLAIGGTASISDYGNFTFSSGVVWKNNDPMTGIIVIPANVTSFSITVPTTDDSVVESSESLVLTVGGVAGTGTITDNDINPSGENKIPDPVILKASLSQGTDNGQSDRDNFTSNINPVIQIGTGNLKLNANNDRVVFYDLNGNFIDQMLVNSNDAETGVINIQAPQLDDGVYSLVSKILDREGNVKAIIPITFTIQTDLDGINPSTELTANNGDYNKDGVADWEQNNVAQFPMSSVTDFQAGKFAPHSTFGALLVGDIDSGSLNSSVHLNANAQLKDIDISEPPAPLPDDFTIASPMLGFTITNENGKALQDVSLTTDGLQTRVVIELPNGGVRANSYLKWNEITREWVKFNDDQRLDTFDDGATLLDVNNDGLIDRIVVTLTDGGIGDHDAIANGTLVDPVVLAWQSSSNNTALVNDPVYSVLLSSGDRYYTTDIKEASQMALGSDNVFEGVRFDSLSESLGGRQLHANYNPFTSDWFFAENGGAMPYNCYYPVDSAKGFSAAPANSGVGQDYYLYLNNQGITQLVSASEASELNLSNNGYHNLGAIFNTTSNTHFNFDPISYLVANKDNLTVKSSVMALSESIVSTKDVNFTEAVEQIYFTQVIGQPTAVDVDGNSSLTDLNNFFQTHFVA